MKTFDKILNMGQSRVGGTRQLASQRKSSSGMSSSLNYEEDNDKFIFNSQIFDISSTCTCTTLYTRINNYFKLHR